MVLALSLPVYSLILSYRLCHVFLVLFSISQFPIEPLLLSLVPLRCVQTRCHSRQKGKGKVFSPPETEQVQPDPLPQAVDESIIHGWELLCYLSHVCSRNNQVHSECIVTSRGLIGITLYPDRKTHCDHYRILSQHSASVENQLNGSIHVIDRRDDRIRSISNRKLHRDNPIGMYITMYERDARLWQIVST